MKWQSYDWKTRNWNAFTNGGGDSVLAEFKDIKGRASIPAIRLMELTYGWSDKGCRATDKIIDENTVPLIRGDRFDIYMMCEEAVNIYFIIDDKANYLVLHICELTGGSYQPAEKKAKERLKIVES